MTIKGIFSADSPDKKIPFPIKKVIQPVLALITWIGNTATPLVRKKVLKQEKLIEDHSLLDADLGTEFLQETIDSNFFGSRSGRNQRLAALLGHLHGGRILEGAPEQKLPAALGAFLLKAYLADRSDDYEELQMVFEQFGETAKIIRDLSLKPDPVTTLEYAQTVMEAVQNLEVGQSFFLSGKGASRSLNYTIVYEFKKNDDDSYDLFVYSMKDYGEILYRDRRDWIRPYRHYENIPSNQLFLNESPDFFKAILETNLSNIHSIQVSPFYTIVSLLDGLHAYLVPPNQEMAGLISSAQSHTDAWSSVKTILYRYLEKDEYKRLVLDIKMESLIRGFQLAKEVLHEEENANLLTILEQGANNILAQLTKMEGDDSISQEILISYRATALDLEKRLSAIKQKRAKARLAKKVELSLTENKEVREARQEALGRANDLVLHPEIAETTACTSVARLQKLWKPTRFVEKLNTFLEEKPESSSLSVVEVEHLVGQFMIPESPKISACYWNEIPEEDLPFAIEGIASLLQTYDYAGREGEIKITPKEANTVFTLYVVLHFLSLREELRVKAKNKRILSFTRSDKGDHPELISSYPLPFPGEFYDEDQFLAYFSPEDFQRRWEIREYCAKTHEHASRINCLFRLDSMSFHNEPNCLKKEGHLEFFGALIRKHPKLKKFRTRNPIIGMEDLLRELALKEGQPNAFKEADLWYVRSLFYAYFVAYQFSGYTHLRNDPKGDLKIYINDFYGNFFQMDFGAGRKKYKDYPGQNQSRKLYPSSDQIHPTVSNVYHKLPESTYASRTRHMHYPYPSGKDEGEILKSEKKHKFKQSILRSCLKPYLQPHALIYHYRNRLDVFANPQEQTLFEIEFFRSVLTKEEGEIFPLEEELDQQGFVQSCQTFIEEGIESYYSLRIGDRPNILATLFFLRLSDRIARFTGEPLVDSLSLIKEMLKSDDLTNEERSNLSLHLILAYSADKERVLTDDDKKKIFRAWVYYKNTPLPPKLRSVSLEKEVFSFLHTLSEPEDFENLEDFRESLLNDVLTWLGVGGLPEDYQLDSVPFPNIRFSSQNEENVEFWEVNLLTGKVCNEEGFLIRGVNPNWIPKEVISKKTRAQKFFTYLFKDREHTYIQTGTTIYFHDPMFGMMRVVKGNILKGLQRRIDNDWYQYIPPLTLDKKEIPKALLADHTHWVPIHKPVHLFFSDFESGELKAVLMHTGDIHPVFFSDSLKIDLSRTFYFGHDMKVLSLLDQEGYITFTDHNGELEKISYSRFQSLSEEPLHFDVEEGQVIYGLNKKYHLSDLHQEGLLGGIPNYLLLVDEKGEKQKVLVPRRSISKYCHLTDRHKIARKEVDVDEYERSQKERFTFLEYDLKRGELISLSAEGRLHLAYLHLASRDYVKAKSLIDKIDFRESLSFQSDQILEDIIEVCEKGGDRSPSSAAVVLTAYRLARRSHSRKGTRNLSPYPLHALRIYYRNQGRIPAMLEVAEKIQTVEGGREATGNASIMDGYIQSLDLTLPYPRLGFSKKYTYKKMQAHANYREAKDKTKFLREEGETSYGKPEIFLTVRYKKGYTQNYFFHHAYQIARKGTDREKEQLRFRLQVMEGVRRQKNEPERSPNAWVILQFALRYPELAPGLPPKDNVIKAWKFLQKINERIAENSASIAIPLMSSPIEEAPSSPLLKEILPQKREVHEVQDRLHLETASKQEIDGGFVKRLFDTHFTPIPKEEIPQEEISFTYDPATATSKTEMDAEAAVTQEFEDFSKDFAKGIEFNAEKQVYQANDLKELNDALTTKSEKLGKKLNNLEVAILEIANKTPRDKKAHNQLLEETKLEQELTMKRLIGLFVTQDREAFLNANPYLNDPAFEAKIGKLVGVEEPSGVVVDYLYNLIGLYLTTAVYKKRLDRAHGHCLKLYDPESEIEKILPELEQEDLIQKMAFELNPKHLAIYETHDNPLFLVFEYLSGFSIRPDQAKHLRKMLKLKPDSIEYRNRVTQMIMGGGKTSVLAVILLKMAAKKGRLSLFVTPSSQYSSVAHNLRKALKEYFDQEMEEIDFKGDQVYTNCGEIKKRIEKTMRRGDFLIVKPETLLCIQLKFLTPILEAVDGDTDKIDEINTLREILKILRDSGEALIDEVDLVLHILREMNIPLGEEQHVAQGRIDIIRELFLLFVTDLDLKRRIGLEKNRQTLVTEKELKGVIAKAVAKKFAKKRDRLKLNHNKDFKRSFYRYISGKMNTDCQKKLNDDAYEVEFTEQDEKDYAFLKYVYDLRHSGDQEKEEVAHQIALIKHMMITVLPMTFTKMGNRHYGRSHQKAGEVTPYLAVDTPSTNHFGYIYEWIAYHFQTAIQCKIDGEQLKKLAELYREGAVNSLKAKRLVINEATDKYVPPEAYEFEKLTGISLDDIDRPGKLEKALKHLNSHPEYLLQMEADTASDQVVYHPFRLTANGISLINMVNARVMSATPYNAHCYEDCLAENFKPQWGTEGRIADVALKRVQADKTRKHVHLVTSRKLDKILDQTLGEHPNKAQISMFMDSGALFKDYTNLEVAKAIRERVNKPVLFFMRDPKKKEATPDTLALLPLESDSPRIIHGTRLSDIEKTGLGINDYIVFADERHTTGTDIPLPYNAIGLMTIDESMLRRSFFQTVLRLRQFFSHQTVEYVIPKRILLTFPEADVEDEQLKIILSCLMGSLRNQALQKARDYYRSRKQKIDSLFEQQLLRKLLVNRRLTKADFRELGGFKKVMELPQEDAPYDQVGALEFFVNTITDLENYASSRLQIFRDYGGDEETATTIEEEISKVIATTAASPWLPKNVMSSGVGELGMEVDILNEVNQAIQQNIQQEIDTELLKELKMYENVPYYSLREDDTWDDPTITALLSEEGDLGESFTPIELPILFDTDDYVSDFTSVFDHRISGTRSWVYSAKRLLPVFHHLQRPAENILIIKTAEGYRAILLSIQEASQFKDFLYRKYEEGKYENVWLVMPDLSPVEDNPAGALQRKEVNDLLIQINAFNGTISYLERHPKQTKKWLEDDEEAQVMKCQFLKLRVARDTAAKKRFFKSPLFNPTLSAEQASNDLSPLHKKVAKMKKKEIQEISEDNKQLLLFLSDTQLQKIKPSQVLLLHPLQLSKLHGPALVSQITEEHKERIVPEQFSDLTEEQKGWFEEEEGESTSTDSSESSEEIQYDSSAAQSNPTTEASSTSTPETSANAEEHISEDDSITLEIIDDAPELKKSVDVRIENSSDEISGIAEKGQGRSIVITLIAIAALGGVIAFAVSVVGAFGIMGAYASWAPGFMVTLGNALGPFYAHYILTVAGPAYLFGLGTLGTGIYCLSIKNNNIKTNHS